MTRTAMTRKQEARATTSMPCKTPWIFLAGTLHVGMKVFALPEVPLGRRTLQNALDSVFSPAILTKVHGPTLKLKGAGAFENGTRSFGFSIDLPTVPPPLKVFFGGETLDVNVRQSVDTRDPAVWHVTNRLKLKCVGAELIKVRPSFTLTDKGGEVSLSARVRHDAVLPPPLDTIAEEFMMLSSAHEMHRLETELRRAGIAQTTGPQSHALHLDSWED